MVVKKCHQEMDTCWVTFNVNFEGAQKVHIVGEWNGWEKEEMKRKRDGSFWITKRLKKGEYRYKYLVNETQWFNDPSADEYVPNPFGGTDSLVVVR